MTLPLSASHRLAIASVLRAARQKIAVDVTATYFQRHPDWSLRYGKRGWTHGVEDALFHLDFLVGAIEVGRVEAFVDYCQWAARVLSARGISQAFLAENLEQVAESLRDHLSEADLAYVAGFTDAGRAACLVPQLPGAAPAATTPAMATTQELFLEALLEGHRRTATTIALHALRSHSVADVYVQIFQAAQHQLGRLWESNRISVAQEHLVTANLQFVLAQAYAQIKPAEPSRGRLLVTGVEGEMHQIGGHMVADVLESEGWDVRFLGTHLPHRGIVEALRRHESDVLGISVTMLFNLANVRELVEQVREQCGPQLRIVVGGAAGQYASAMCAEHGVEVVGGDLRAALALLCPAGTSPNVRYANR